jgi:hypothetical protein
MKLIVAWARPLWMGNENMTPVIISPTNFPQLVLAQHVLSMDN